MPAAEEQDHQQEGRGDHVQELGDHEHHQLHSGVLGTVAGDQFLLGLDQVEGQPSGFGEGGHEEDQETQRLDKYVPAAVGLLADDRVQPQGSGGQHHPQHSQPQGDLVGDQLGPGSQPAEKAVLVVARPPTEDRAEDGQSPHGEDVDHSHVHQRCGDQMYRFRLVHDAPFDQQIAQALRQNAAEGDHRKDRQGGHQDGYGSQEIEELVDVAGRELFLEDELRAVGDRLAEAEDADLGQGDAHPIRPPPVLDPGRDPPLDQHQVGGGAHQAADQQADFQQGFDNRIVVSQHLVLVPITV